MYYIPSIWPGLSVNVQRSSSITHSADKLANIKYPANSYDFQQFGYHMIQQWLKVYVTLHRLEIIFINFWLFSEHTQNSFIVSHIDFHLSSKTPILSTDFSGTNYVKGFSRFSINWCSWIPPFKFVGLRLLFRYEQPCIDIIQNGAS